MVFTIVTVIFLPLSFIAAFFAIDITAFPHDAHGNLDMPLTYVSKYVFGVGLSIALLCVFIAISVGRLTRLAKKLAKNFRSDAISPEDRRRSQALGVVGKTKKSAGGDNILLSQTHPLVSRASATFAGGGEMLKKALNLILWRTT